MTKNRILPIMFFVLGLFLITVGIGLALITRTVTELRDFYGLQIPVRVTIYPYQGLGIFLVIFGIIVLTFAFFKTRGKKPD